MAYAVGVVGMMLHEWMELSPDEWLSVAEAYNNQAEQTFRTEWERMRMLATISVQPHVKNRLTPSRLLPPTLSKEEARKRFMHLIERG